MNFLHQGFRKLSYYRQTRPKLYTMLLRGWSVNSFLKYPSVASFVFLNE